MLNGKEAIIAKSQMYNFSDHLWAESWLSRKTKIGRMHTSQQKISEQNVHLICSFQTTYDWARN